LVVDGTGKTAGRLRCQVGGQRWHPGFSTTRIVGKFNRDRFGGALWNGAVQLFDGPFGLLTLIEAYEADTLGETCVGEECAMECFRRVFFYAWTSYSEKATLYYVCIIVLKILCAQSVTEFCVITTKILCGCHNI
jgi:hypothetical protein